MALLQEVIKSCETADWFAHTVPSPELGRIPLSARAFCPALRLQPARRPAIVARTGTVRYDRCIMKISISYCKV